MRLLLAVMLVVLLAECAWILALSQRIKELEFKVGNLAFPGVAGKRPPPPDPRNLAQGQLAPHLMRLLEMNQSLHKDDRERYGEEVHALYLQARLSDQGPGTLSERADSERALSKLLEKYPEANATAMAIAERALESAMRRKTTDAEFYFNMLSKHKNHQGIVTDKGVEAYSSLLVYLIHQYIRDRRSEQAEELIRQLEADYGDKLVADQDRSGEPDWRPGSEIAGTLRRELGNPPVAPDKAARTGG
jgi:hypothetical protein